VNLAIRGVLDTLSTVSIMPERDGDSRGERDGRAFMPGHRGDEVDRRCSGARNTPLPR